MIIETPKTELQLQKQAEDAFYSNARLDSTNAIDVDFVRKLEKEIIQLKDLSYKLAEYSNPRATKVTEYWDTIEKIEKILKQ